MPRYDPVTNTKQCSLCGEFKAPCDFHARPIAKDGLMSRCKKCLSITDKKRRDDRIALGLCPSCGIKNDNNGMRLCISCQQKMRERSLNYSRSEKGRKTQSEYAKSEKHKTYVSSQKYRERKRERRSTERAKENNRLYQLNKLRTNLQHKIAKSLRDRVYAALKGRCKTGSGVSDLGCSVSEFVSYIESLWTDGMSWSNWGKGSCHWNIDHIRPLYTFDLTDREQFLKATNYTNMRPLWETDNLTRNGVMLRLLKTKSPEDIDWNSV